MRYTRTKSGHWIDDKRVTGSDWTEDWEPMDFTKPLVFSEDKQLLASTSTSSVSSPLPPIEQISMTTTPVVSTISSQQRQALPRIQQKEEKQTVKAESKLQEEPKPVKIDQAEKAGVLLEKPEKN